MGRPEETKPTDAELTEDELAEHVAEPLPDREAMSLIDPSPGVPPLDDAFVPTDPDPTGADRPEQL